MADWGRYNTMDVVDPDQMFICPYDPVHVIRACRMPYHLMKCRKNYTNNDMRTCPFNARHVVPIAEHRYHMVTCPDRKVLEDLANHAQSLEEPDQDGAYFKGDTSVPAYDSWEAPPPEEDWDQEAADHHAVTTQSHQDQEAEELTAKDLALMTPAQKKNYKRKLRKEQERKAAESAAQMNGAAAGSTKLRIPQNFSAAACLSNQPATQVHKHTVQPAQPDNLTYSLNMGGAGRGLLMSQRSAGPPPIKRPGPKIAANIFGNSATQPTAPVQTQQLTNGHSNGIVGGSGANLLGNSATPPAAPLQTLTNGHSNAPSGPAVGSHGASSLSDAELLACLGRGRGLACLQKSLQSTVGRPPAPRTQSDGGMPALEGLTNGHNSHVTGHNGHVTSPATIGAPSPLPPPRYDSPSSSASDSQADVPVEKVGEAKKKRLYKLQKKLAQIAALEQNASQGRQLSEKEKAKVQTKVALQAELRDVEWELMDLELGDN